jgi:hypothetical protein
MKISQRVSALKLLASFSDDAENSLVVNVGAYSAQQTCLAMQICVNRACASSASASDSLIS